MKHLFVVYQTPIAGYWSVMVCKNCGYKVLKAELFNKHMDRHLELDCRPRRN